MKGDISLSCRVDHFGEDADVSSHDVLSKEFSVEFTITSCLRVCY